MARKDQVEADPKRKAKSVKITAKTPKIGQRQAKTNLYLMKYHDPPRETFKITVEIRIVSAPFPSCQNLLHNIKILFGYGNITCQKLYTFGLTPSLSKAHISAIL